MKKQGYLYKKVYDLANIELAHYNARKGKAHYKEVQMVDENAEFYFRELQTMLKNKTYKNSEYKIMTKKTDSGKINKYYTFT